MYTSLDTSSLTGHFIRTNCSIIVKMSPHVILQWLYAGGFFAISDAVKKPLPRRSKKAYH